MPTGFVQVPADATGKRLETRWRTDPTDGDLHTQAVFNKAAETWVAIADLVGFATNKHHFTLFNAAGTGRIVKVRKLFLINVQTTGVTGVALRFNVIRCSAASAGTTITPVAMDTDNVALPAGVTARTNGTVTDGPLLFPWVTSNEEESAVAALSKSLFQQSVNMMLEGNEVQELTLREGQGFSVKQITASSISANFAWLCAFTVEAP